MSLEKTMQLGGAHCHLSDQHPKENEVTETREKPIIFVRARANEHLRAAVADDLKDIVEGWAKQDLDLKIDVVFDLSVFADDDRHWLRPSVTSENMYSWPHP